MSLNFLDVSSSAKPSAPPDLQERQQLQSIIEGLIFMGAVN